MAKQGMKSFNYAIGMFGTSIPINLLKTFAAAFYVKDLGLITAAQWAGRQRRRAVRQKLGQRPGNARLEGLGLGHGADGARWV